MPKEAPKVNSSSKLGTSPLQAGSSSPIVKGSLSFTSDPILSTSPIVNTGISHNPVFEISRLQKDEQERKEIYETAQANFNTIVEEARADNIQAYRAAKLKITQCAGEVAAAQALVKEKVERLDQVKQLQVIAREELENVKKAYDLNTEVWWQAERTLVSLKKDEMAKLQMVQALVDWREAEVSLRTHELNEQEKAKDIIEKPYEMAQADLWKTGEELKRLGIDLTTLDNEDHNLGQVS